MALFSSFYHRALVKDETITPLLYRVNGLFRSRGISSVIVIGGVGDWLDVPDHVILMDKDYKVHDALQRARSISHQFSYGHIQYGGRGVVHRLEWKKYEDSKSENIFHGSRDDDIEWLVVDDINPRDRYIHNAQLFDGGKIVLLDGGGKFCIAVHNEKEETHRNGSTTGTSIALSKCEQIAGNIWQTMGCAVALQWIIHNTTLNSNTPIKSLIDSFDFESFSRRMVIGMEQVCIYLELSSVKASDDEMIMAWIEWITINFK
jgi:hypothetical protein